MIDYPLVSEFNRRGRRGTQRKELTDYKVFHIFAILKKLAKIWFLNKSSFSLCVLGDLCG
jgi:hypothetical protein